MDVLFLGKGSDCRPLLAEAIFNHLAPEHLSARRLACDREEALAPAALALLAAQGIRPVRAGTPAICGEPSASDVVITICSADADGRCPHRAAMPLHAHWAVHDPLRRHFFAHREDRELLDVYHILRARIERLVPLLLAGVEQDRLHLGRELERIGRFLP